MGEWATSSAEAGICRQAATPGWTGDAPCYGLSMDLDQLSRSLGPLQETMRKADAERAGTTLIGSAGGGAVKVTLTGALTVSRVEIAPAAAAASSGEVGMLEDLIAAATNDALRQYRTRFGASPEDQIQKLFAGGGMGPLLAPLMASLGRK